MQEFKAAKKLEVGQDKYIIDCYKCLGYGFVGDLFADEPIDGCPNCLGTGIIIVHIHEGES